MSFSKEVMKGVAETVVLQVLNDLSESYGYQLTTAIARSSNNIFQFQEGTVYPLLYRLEMKGFVRSTKKRAPSGKIRRYYRITNKGMRVMESQLGELQQMYKGLQQLLRLSV